MIIFQKIPPEKISDLPKSAIRYLDDAIKHTPASTARLDVTLEMAAKGYGNIYLMWHDNWLTGACYILVYDTPDGKVTAPVLVGGVNMHLWHDDFYEFIQKFSRQVGAIKINWIGRKGWLKAFPKAKVIGHVFEHAVDYPEG